MSDQTLPAADGPVLAEPTAAKTRATVAQRLVSIGYLRAFIVVLVVVHHSVLAYVGGIPVGRRFAGGEMIWRAFPVVDSRSWAPAGLISGFNDVFFMSLMFLLSGLFVWRGLKDKGPRTFLRDRLLRLGLPFIVSAGLITPIAYYTAYLQSGGAPGLANFWRAWMDIGYWPTGPAWFVLLLLAFDIVAAGLFVLMPKWGEQVGGLASRAAERPVRFFWLLAALSLAAYAPLAMAFGPGGWTYWGLLQFQSSRLLHYFIYFALGVGIGAFGIERGLLSSSGQLARRWPIWVLAAAGAFALGGAVFVLILTSTTGARAIWMQVGSLTFVLACAAICFAFLALFVRFARERNPIFDSLERNAYGIYLVHYAFVAWVQYALLTSLLAGGAKAGVVIAAALAASWASVAVLRKIPAIARIV